MHSLLKSKWFLMTMIVVSGWLGLSFVRIKFQEIIVHKEVSNLKSKANRLEESNSSLEKLITYLKDPLFLEKEARLKLNYKAPGEQVAFVYRDQSALPSSRSLDFGTLLRAMPNYKKWWYYLMGY